jgi:hypothetical protein
MILENHTTGRGTSCAQSHTGRPLYKASQEMIAKHGKTGEEEGEGEGEQQEKPSCP